MTAVHRPPLILLSGWIAVTLTAVTVAWYGVRPVAEQSIAEPSRVTQTRPRDRIVPCRTQALLPTVTPSPRCTAPDTLAHISTDQANGTEPGAVKLLQRLKK